MNNSVMRCVSILLLMPLFLTFTTLSAQENNTPKFTVNGQILQISGEEPVAFANVGVIGTYLGTATSEEGTYSLTIDSMFIDYDVMISAIGYESKQVSLRSLIENSEVMLEPTSYEISTVNVEAKSAVLFGYLRKAVQHINENYAAKPYNYEFKLQTKIASQAEATTKQAVGYLYDETGYQRENYAAAFKHVNYNFRYSRQNTERIPFDGGLTVMDDILLGDVVRFSGNVLDTTHFEDYQLSLVRMTNFNNDSVYVIGFKNVSPKASTTRVAHVSSYEGEVFVRSKDFAVVRSSLIVKADRTSRHGVAMVEADKRSPYGKKLNLKLTTSYKEEQGQMYISSIHMNKQFINQKNKPVKVVADFTVEDFRQNKLKKIVGRDYYNSAPDNVLKFK